MVSTFALKTILYFEICTTLTNSLRKLTMHYKNIINIIVRFGRKNEDWNQKCINIIYPCVTGIFLTYN